MNRLSAAPEYEVHAIRYTHDPRRRLSEDFPQSLTKPADLRDSAMPMDFFIWVLVAGRAHAVRVDLPPAA